MRKRVFILGLDCLAPKVLEQMSGQLPELERLGRQGAWALLRSVHPPITVPAWACAASGYDAGQLGLYGFRNRQDYSYQGLRLALADQVRRLRLWDHLDQAGLKTVVVGVPPLFPVPQLGQGRCVGCFLTPGESGVIWAQPPEFGRYLEQLTHHSWMTDAAPFRTDDRPGVLQRIYQMTRQHFDAACHLARQPDWDLVFWVQMGPDRLHHAFWQFWDPEHPHHPGTENPYAEAIPQYYRFLDHQLGRLRRSLPEDVLLLVISDHGARALQGAISVNQWLVQRGYLVLHHQPEGPTPLQPHMVNWSRTLAWSEGGYYARVFLNVKGREPQGTIEPSAYESWRDRLAQELEALPDAQGRPLPTCVFKPQELFASCQGTAPDLICYLGNLSHRSVGQVGGPVHWNHNDTGPDGANHDWDGVFFSSHPLHSPGSASRLNLIDLGPSVLEFLQLPVPDDCSGRAAWKWSF